MHDEKVSASFNTAQASSQPVTMVTPWWLFAGHGALLPESLVVGVGVLDEPFIAEEVHLGEVVHHRLLRSNLG